MRYVESKAKQLQRDETYRVYISDALQLIAYNTDAAFCGKGMHGVLEKRYADIAYGTEEPEAEEDPRSCKEIVSEMWKNLKKERRTEHG